MSRAHRLNPVGNQTTEGPGQGDGDVQNRDTLALIRWRVDLGNGEGKGWEETGFKETEKYAAGNDLAVVVDETGADGDGAPADDGDGEDAARAESFDSDDPGCFEYDI